MLHPHGADDVYDAVDVGPRVGLVRRRQLHRARALQEESLIFQGGTNRGKSGGKFKLNISPGRLFFHF